MTQRDKALASGAQFISTDYAEPDRRFSDYSVRFPGGQVARSNPISGDPAWADLDLETGKPAPVNAKESSGSVYPQGLASSRLSSFGPSKRSLP